MDFPFGIVHYMSRFPIRFYVPAAEKVFGNNRDLFLEEVLPNHTCMCAGRIAWAVDGKSPINFVEVNKRLFGIVKEDPHIGQESCLILFFSVWARVTFTVSVINPSNSIFCVGSRTDFFMFVIRPKC